MRKATDLAGKQVGDIRVIQRIESPNKYPVWECECLKCSSKFERTSNQLTYCIRKTPGCPKCGVTTGEAGKEALEKYHDKMVIEGIKIQSIIDNLSGKLGKRNTTGCTGVTFYKGSCRVTLDHGGNRQNLGLYKNLDDAIYVRKMEEIYQYSIFLERHKEQIEENVFNEIKELLDYNIKKYGLPQQKCK